MNLEQTIETEVVGDGEEVGKLTVPARLFGDYLQSNADKEILIEGDDTTLKISSLNHKAQIKGLPAEEYPSVPQAKGESSVELPTSKIVEAISRCIIASAQDDSRPILNSLLWRFKGKNLVVVGTDGYLASCEIALNQETEGDFILPRRTMAELSKLDGSDTITMSASTNQVKFVVGDTRLTSRVLDGSYPAYEAIIPKKTPTTLTVASSSLLQGLRMASLFSRDSAYSTKILFKDNKITITAVSTQLGENTNEIPLTEKVESEVIVSINAQYLIDALAVLSGDVQIGLNDAKSPIVVRPTGGEKMLYLLMPLRSD